MWFNSISRRIIWTLCSKTSIKPSRLKQSMMSVVHFNRLLSLEPMTDTEKASGKTKFNVWYKNKDGSLHFQVLHPLGWLGARHRFLRRSFRSEEKQSVAYFSFYIGHWRIFSYICFRLALLLYTLTGERERLNISSGSFVFSWKEIGQSRKWSWIDRCVTRVWASFSNCRSLLVRPFSQHCFGIAFVWLWLIHVAGRRVFIDIGVASLMENHCIVLLFGFSRTYRTL